MTTINRYITGFSVSNKLPKEAQEMEIENWASQHSEEHEIFFNALNGLNTSMGQSSYKINFSRLGFNVQDVKSFDNFAGVNLFQMNQFYEWINILGGLLPNYGKPVIIVYPLINPIKNARRLDLNMMNKFMLYEEKSHTIVSSAVNQLYSALGV